VTGSRAPVARDDAGTVLVLLLGFVAVLVLMVAVVVNVSSVILAKRALVSAADGAAVSAAQALDLEALYAGGLSEEGIPLDSGLAAQRVAEYEAGATAGQPGLQLVLARIDDGTTVVVQGVREVQLPFGRMIGFEPVQVRAEARARAPVLPP
jgi:uncharacterized membrane protein